MDFWDLAKLLLRRWYVAVPLLLITVSSAAFTWFYIKPDYKIIVYVQLIPPPAPTATSPNQVPEELRNPWLDLGLASLNSAASLTTVNAEFLGNLGERGLSDNITITQGYPNPIAQIEVVGSSEEQTLATADLVATRFIDTVATLQNDRQVSANSMIRTFRLDTGKSLEETGGKVKRAVIAVGAAGMLMTVALTVGFDAFRRRRHRRRRFDPDGLDPDGLANDRVGGPRVGPDRAGGPDRPGASGRDRPGASGRDRPGASGRDRASASGRDRAGEHDHAGRPAGPTRATRPPRREPSAEWPGASSPARPGPSPSVSGPPVPGPSVPGQPVARPSVFAWPEAPVSSDLGRSEHPARSEALGPGASGPEALGPEASGPEASGPDGPERVLGRQPVAGPRRVPTYTIPYIMPAEGMPPEAVPSDAAPMGQARHDDGADHRGAFHHQTDHHQADHRGTDHRGTDHRGTDHRGVDAVDGADLGAGETSALPMPPDATIVLPLAQAPRRRGDGEGGGRGR